MRPVSHQAKSYPPWKPVPRQLISCIPSHRLQGTPTQRRVAKRRHNRRARHWKGPWKGEKLA